MNLAEFYEASNPRKTIDMGNPKDRKYYINFAPVRGRQVIKLLNRTITRLSPNNPTCQLFTGHIGCGKSTELLRLKDELQNVGFHVVYFQVTDDLDLAEVDITEILLAIAHQISKSLEKNKVALPTYGLRGFLKEVGELLQIPIELEEFKLSLGIAEITTKTKNSQQLRSRLRAYAEPQTTKILRLINEEIIKVATDQLKQQGKQGLVVIVDNLDRIENKPPSFSNELLPKYLFIDRGKQLKEINCHLIYTLPLSLIFSNEREPLRLRLSNPIVLPMIPVQLRDGKEYTKGINLLRQMVLARAFPDAKLEERMGLTEEVFDSLETLDRLCRISGGHVRYLLQILYGCLQEEDPPISRSVLERVIQRESDGLLLAIDEREWELLFQVAKEKKVKGEEEYQTLLRSLFVFEYNDEQGRSWFALNPLLLETEKYKSMKMS